MSKFKVGDKVFVTGSTFSPCNGTISFIGKFGWVKHIHEGVVGVYNEDRTDWFAFNKSDLLHATAAPKEITINGATYVLKEEQKPAHEWKFGDWARHPDYGVVFVGNVNRPSEIWCVVQDGDGWHYGQHVSPNNLTYISSATIPV